MGVRTMRDSITVDGLRLMAENGDPVPDAFGGYDDGRYADADAIQAAFPGVPVLRFTVFPSDNEGDCLDVESGDANPEDAPGWITRRRGAGHTWPMTYCSESLYGDTVRQFQAQQVPFPLFILAGYPGMVGEGVVYPWPNVAGHQYADRGPYDESVLVDWLPLFGPLAAPAPPPPPPPPPGQEGFTMLSDLVSYEGQFHQVHIDPVHHEIWHHWRAQGDITQPGKGWSKENWGTFDGGFNGFVGVPQLRVEQGDTANPNGLLICTCVAFLGQLGEKYWDPDRAAWSPWGSK